MSKQVGVLVLVGALVAGGAAMVVLNSSGGALPSATSSKASGPTSEAQAPETSSPAATPMPAAMASGAVEPCDTPAKIEPEAAPIAKFLEAPCAAGDEETVAPISGAGAPSESSVGARP